MTTSDLLSAAASTVRVVPYSGPKMQRQMSVWREFIAQAMDLQSESDRAADEFWREFFRNDRVTHYYAVLD